MLGFGRHRDYNRLKLAFDLLDKYIGHNLLDLGCGRDAFLERWFKDHNVIGLDISTSNIQRARVFAPNARFVLGDIKRLPICDESMDNVVMLAVLGCVPFGEESAVFREASRVLKSGGYLMLMVSNERQPYSVLTPYRIFGNKGWRSYNSQSLQNQLQNEGFCIEKIVFAGGMLSLFETILRFFESSLGQMFSCVSHKTISVLIPRRWINRLTAWEYNINKGERERRLISDRFIYIVARKI
ncbi:class I SAM-dependent methyltransferase [Chloroflexota bacterium]